MIHRLISGKQSEQKGKQKGLTEHFSKGHSSEKPLMVAMSQKGGRQGGKEESKGVCASG